VRTQSCDNDPPAIRKASMLIPKKDKTYSPKKEIIIITKHLQSTAKFRFFFVIILSKSNKIGTVPIGLITEKAQQINK
jgi:hypothetical protein